MGAFGVIVDALLAQQLQDAAKRREVDRSRPIGTEGVRIGLTDYRRKPDPSIHSTDYAVWLVRWTGSAWHDKKRLSAKLSSSEARDARRRHAEARGIEVVE